MRRVVFIAVVVWIAIGITLAAIVASEPFSKSFMSKVMAMKEDWEANNRTPQAAESIPVVDGKSAHGYFENHAAVFLDTGYGDEAEKIPGAKRLSYESLISNPKLAAKLDKSKTYVVYCESPCWRSPAVAMVLRQLGFKNIYWYREGLPDWEKRGYPTA